MLQNQEIHFEPFEKRQQELIKNGTNLQRLSVLQHVFTVKRPLLVIVRHRLRGILFFSKRDSQKAISVRSLS